MRSGAVFALLSCVLAASAWAKPGALGVDVEDAADHHVSAQGDYHGGLSQSWEWALGSGRSSKNITGIAAHGLLAAHRLTGLKEHESAALRAAESLIGAYDRGWRARHPYTQDVEFLVAAGFVIDAAKWFRVLSGRWDAGGYVDYVADRRSRVGQGSAAGWDIASAIRAAVAVGDVAYARGLLERLIQRRATWDRADSAHARELSHASLLWALGALRGRVALTGEQQRFAADVLRTVQAAQGPAGGWLTADGAHYSSQTTAYAVLGLAAWGQGQRAAARGRAWLRRVALTDRRFFLGGLIWPAHYDRNGKPDGTFISEVQSEVLQALAAAR